MECKKKAVCNICEGAFKMTRGCNLEKRCPACRILYPRGVQTHEQIVETSRDYDELYWSYFTKESKKRMGYRGYPMKGMFFPFHILDKVGMRTDIRVFEDVYLEEISREVNKWLSAVLDDRSKLVVQMRLGLAGFEEDITFEAIAKVLGVSKSRVGQIEKDAIRKLKHPRSGRIMRLVMDEYNYKTKEKEDE